jgi:hypothetical protein
VAQSITMAGEREREREREPVATGWRWIVRNGGVKDVDYTAVTLSSTVQVCTVRVERYMRILHG